MELKLVIEGLDDVLANITEQLVELNGCSVVQQNELLDKLETVRVQILDNLHVITLQGQETNEKLDAVHTMLSHLADTQATHGVQLNAIMAALYTPK